MIEIAVWILAVVGVIRIVQNGIQLKSLSRDEKERKRAYNEFIESLNKSNKEYVRELINAFEE